MKKIENIKFALNPDGKTETERQVKTTGELAEICVKVPPKEGFDVNLMRKRLRVTDAIELAKRNDAMEIKLEDADYDELKKCVNVMRWGSASRAIIEFVDFINNAEKAE